MRVARILVACVLAFCAIEGIVFHTELYPWILNPDSSTGDLETILRNERERPKNGPQVLGIGDSRMLLMPRIANQHTAETGYTFGNIAVAGVAVRNWYYMLRDVDPTARGYRAIVMAMASYDDPDLFYDAADSEIDLRHIIARLRLGDIWEYSHSYHSPELKWKAARGIVFKGLVYKTDFQDLLVHPFDRFRYAALSHRESFGWQYGYSGQPDTLSGFQVDWQARTVTAPPNADPALANRLQTRLMDPLPEETGEQSRYLKYWLGKVADYYRDSPTRLIFFRLPRGGWVRPDQPRYRFDSSVREVSGLPNVVLSDEHLFDSLEKPELFKDEMHLNALGMERFSVMLTQAVQQTLGPPAGFPAAR